MTSGEVLDIFRECGALLEGHFIYTSGRHGRQFIQAARVLQYPKHTERLCKAMAGAFAGHGVQLVVGPATGGIILAYETARHLGCRAAFTEKEGDGMAVKRGFKIDRGAKTLVVEDIVTTGGSVKKTVSHLRERGADVIGVSVLIDRSGGMVIFDCDYKPLASLALESWGPDDTLPEDLREIPAVDPDDLMG